MNKLKLVIPILLFFAFNNLSCSVYQTMVNISRLKFKLGVVNNFTLNGVNLSNKKSINDLSIPEALKLTSAFAKGSMPATFTLNVNALNPNDGTGGYPKTNATIVAFPWRLMINNKETVTGDIGSPFSVPGTGEAAVIPIQITIDLYKFFKDNTYQDLIALAMKLSGSGSSTGGSPSDLALYVKPTVSSPLGNITYPQEIKVINYEYTK
ncbi:MAG: hypothetical protein P4L35_08670 [Ignavibacteriaceae bacterium]|nr:hypothetical protein [Ignavibacteriaceae bacterium]